MGPTINPPTTGMIMMRYHGVEIMFSRRLPVPGNEISEKNLIIARIPIAEKPARTPIMIATIIIKVCSVIFALSKRAVVLRESLE
jgi:hypothetical protein